MKSQRYLSTIASFLAVLLIVPLCYGKGMPASKNTTGGSNGELFPATLAEKPPKAPKFPKLPKIPKIPKAKGVPKVPEIPQIPKVPKAPKKG